MYCMTAPGLAQRFKKLASAGAQSYQQKFSELRNFLTFSVTLNLRFYEKRTFFRRNIEKFIHRVLPALKVILVWNITVMIKMNK